MLKLLMLMAATLTLTYCSQKRIGLVLVGNKRMIDIPLVTMIVILSLFCGLRTSFNDTATYIAGFQNAGPVSTFFRNDLNLLGNPAFYIFQSSLYASDNSPDSAYKPRLQPRRCNNPCISSERKSADTRVGNLRRCLRVYAGKRYMQILGFQQNLHK